MINLQEEITPKSADKLHDKGVLFLEAELIFRRKIYTLCDKSIGEKILFTGFTLLWPDLYCNFNITPKGLTYLTSIIINELIRQKIVKEVSSDFSPPPIVRDLSLEHFRGFISFYPRYEILDHMKLFT